MDAVTSGAGKMIDDDRAALIDCLRALPPIKNLVEN
jgi:hypothetical protein